MQKAENRQYQMDACKFYAAMMLYTQDMSEVTVKLEIFRNCRID